MKLFIYLIGALLLTSCATSVPRNKQNACLLLHEKDEWKDPLVRASKKWGIPKHTILSIVYHESSYVPDAKPPRRKVMGIGFLGRRISSAYGYPQALDGTWEEYVRKTRNWGAQRDNFEDAVDFIGWYLNRSAKRLGISKRDAYKLYLAYHQGDNGFRRGSYKRKPAIKRYARKVQSTAVTYKKQIRSCNRYAYYN